MIKYKKGEDIPVLTGLRFFAAFAIVIHHTLLSIFSTQPDGNFRFFLSSMGSLGMSLFFVLSGFIIYHNYFDKVKSLEFKKIYNFIVARIARLYPLFIFFVFIDMLYLARNHYLETAADLNKLKVLPYFFTLTQTWFYAIRNGLPISLPFAFSNITWSISTEFLLYLVFPILTVIYVKFDTLFKSIFFFIFVVMASIGLKYIFMQNQANIDSFALSFFGDKAAPPLAAPVYTFYSWLIFNSPYIRIFEFLMGISIAHIYHLDKDLSGSYNKTVKYLGYLAFLFIIILSTKFRSLLGFDTFFEISGYGPVLTILIFSLVYSEFILKNIFSWRIFIILGEMSYSIYLLHTLVLHRFKPESEIKNILNLAFALLVLYFLSKLSYRFIETPSRKYLRQKLALKS